MVVAADPRELLTLARRADGILTGAVGVQATGPTKWNYHARQHVFFALEEDVHRGSLAALALPPLPHDVRESLGDGSLELQHVDPLPEAILRAARHKAGRAPRSNE